MTSPADRHTLVKFKKDAIDAIYAGARQVAEATATTLGPLGRNVLIEKQWGEPVILHDGVSVAISINPEDPWERQGAKVMQEATKKQRDAVGDGTTVSAILTMSILDRALEATASGVNPMTLRKGLESGADKVIHKIKELSTEVKTLDQKIQIGTISAEDPDLGELVAKTVHDIGEAGVITVEESKALETFVEKQEGMQIDKGYAHFLMMTDNERQLAVLDDTYILVTDQPLKDLVDLATFLDTQVFPNTKKCVFISPDIGGDFVQALIGAKIQGKFLGLAVNAPGVGDHQHQILQDICALTGATLVTKEAGHELNKMTFEVLGKAQRVQSTKISTIITGGSGHKDDILQRIQVIKTQLNDPTISEFDKEQLKGRLGKLTNGVAVIKVGAQTEIEMKERKERVIDAVASVQAAIQHGFVPGGEVIYLNVLDELDEDILGEKILKEALVQPFKRLVENAGYDGGEKLAERRTKHLEASAGREGKAIHFDTGLDVVDGEFKTMVEAGIIDATSISTTAIKTAVSVAVQLSSLGAGVVIENLEKHDTQMS